MSEQIQNILAALKDALDEVDIDFLLVNVQSGNTPDNIWYHYSGLIGGACTLLAALIAVWVSVRLYKLGRAPVVREEENYRQILKTEVGEVHRKLELYVNHIEGQPDGYKLVEIDALRPKADECEFEIPESLFDYAVLSKLDPKTMKHTIQFRDGLVMIKKTYYGDNIAKAPIGLYKDCKQALDLFEKAFGIIVRVPSAALKTKSDDITLRKNAPPEDKE